MISQCDIIRDLLPLYADDVLSTASRNAVEEHLRDCPACSEYLNQIRDSEQQTDLDREKALVIRHQARRFKRRSAAVGSVIATLFMVPILICLIVNLTTGRGLDWFYVVAAGMLVAASLIIVPLTVPEDRLFWTFCAFDLSLIILLAVCALYSHGRWFFTAASAAQFGLSTVFLPFLLRAKPLKRWVEGRNRTLLVIAMDTILFANMMNMISLHSKSFFTTVGMAVLCVAGFGLLIAGANREENEKHE